VSPGMVDRLNEERHRRFVGRVTERDLFRSVLASDRPPFNVLYVLGPGGVGKTTRGLYVWDVSDFMRTIGLLPEL
jgi:hypothetical protein